MTFFFAIMLSSQLQTKIQAHFHVYAPRLFQSYNWNPICTSLITCTFVPKSEDSLKNTSPKMFFTWVAYDPFLALCHICEIVFVSQDTISITSSHALAVVTGPRLRSWQEMSSHWILVGLHGKGPILWTMQISC